MFGLLFFITHTIGLWRTYRFLFYFYFYCCSEDPWMGYHDLQMYDTM